MLSAYFIMNTNCFIRKFLIAIGLISILSANLLPGNSPMHSVVINEIMAAPKANRPLPNAEYIELYNKTDSAISLNGYAIVIGKRLKPIPNCVIKSKNYLLLVHSKKDSLFAADNRVIAIDKLPNLNNTAGEIALLDADSNLVHFAQYNQLYYNDIIRDSGGYSLEMVDFNFPCDRIGNWKACQNEAGGTPLHTNSVVDINADTSAPKVLSFEISGDSSIAITFDKFMDINHPQLKWAVSINNNIGYPTESYMQTWANNTLHCKFDTTPFQTNTAYTVFVAGGLNCCAGNSTLPTEFKFSLPELPNETDLVINEIMYEPYNTETEFIELYNNTKHSISLKGMTVYDGKYYKKITSKNYIINANDYVILTKSKYHFCQLYSLAPQYKVIETDSWVGLSNNGKELYLFDSLRQTLDYITYSPKLHSKNLIETKGISLERINPTLASNAQNNWSSSINTTQRCTPLEKNSIYSTSKSNAPVFSVFPKELSVSEGIYKSFKINYNCPERGWIVKVIAFTPQGKLVELICQQKVLEPEGSLEWTMTNSETTITPGFYILYIEAFSERGGKMAIKESVLLLP